MIHQRILAHPEGIWSVTFGPDGRTLFTASRDHTARRWVLGQALGPRLRKELESQVLCLDFAPDGQTLAAGTRQGSVHLGRLAAKEWSLRWQAFSDGVLSLAYSPDGKTLAGSGMNKVMLWDPATGQSRGTLRAAGLEGPRVAYSPNGRFLAAGSIGNVRVWDTRTARLFPSPRTATKGLPYVAFSPDSGTLAAQEHAVAVSLWDPSTGARRATLEAPFGHSITAAAFSPDGRTLVTVHMNHTGWLWDLEARKVCHVLLGHTREVMSAAFTPDGKTLATAGRDGTVRLWHVHTGQEMAVLSVNSGFLHGVTFSPDGEVLAAGGGTPDDKGLVALWRASRD
jgi:WD40 repeat protein